MSSGSKKWSLPAGQQQWMIMPSHSQRQLQQDQAAHKQNEQPSQPPLPSPKPAFVMNIKNLRCNQIQMITIRWSSQSPGQSLTRTHISSWNLAFQQRAKKSSSKLKFKLLSLGHIKYDRTARFIKINPTSRPILNNKKTTPNSAIAFVPCTWRIIERP